MLRRLARAKEREIESQELIKELSSKNDYASEELGKLDEEKRELQGMLAGKAKLQRELERSLGELRLQVSELEAYRGKYEESKTR